MNPMTNDQDREFPPHGRLVAAGMAAAGAFGLVLNHFLPASQTVGRLLLLCLGPIAVLLGIGGVVEPRIVWAVGKYGRDLPVVYKIIGGALGIAGLAVTILLFLFVYRLGPPG
jgi:hypothetical protein